jgi:hypothetical protein
VVVCVPDALVGYGNAPASVLSPTAPAPAAPQSADGIPNGLATYLSSQQSKQRYIQPFATAQRVLAQSPFALESDPLQQRDRQPVLFQRQSHDFAIAGRKHPLAHHAQPFARRASIKRPLRETMDRRHHVRHAIHHHHSAQLRPAHHAERAPGRWRSK